MKTAMLFLLLVGSTAWAQQPDSAYVAPNWSVSIATDSLSVERKKNRTLRTDNALLRARVERAENSAALKWTALVLAVIVGLIAY